MHNICILPYLQYLFVYCWWCPIFNIYHALKLFLICVFYFLIVKKTTRDAWILDNIHYFHSEKSHEYEVANKHLLRSYIADVISKYTINKRFKRFGYYLTLTTNALFFISKICKLYSINATVDV